MKPTHPMKNPSLFFVFPAAALAGVLMSSCEKPEDEPMEEVGSPATQVSPSEPVPQPTEVQDTDAETDDAAEP